MLFNRRRLDSADLDEVLKFQTHNDILSLTSSHIIFFHLLTILLTCNRLSHFPVSPPWTTNTITLPTVIMKVVLYSPTSTSPFLHPTPLGIKHTQNQSSFLPMIPDEAVYCFISRMSHELAHKFFGLLPGSSDQLPQCYVLIYYNKQIEFGSSLSRRHFLKYTSWLYSLAHAVVKLPKCSAPTPFQAATYIVSVTVKEYPWHFATFSVPWNIAKGAWNFST